MHHVILPAILEEAIRLLEIEHAKKGELLKEQFHLTYGSLKPASLLKSTINEINLSEEMMSEIVKSTLNFATRYLCEKIVVGNSTNIYRNIFATIIKISAANIVAQNPDAIKSVSQFILQYVLNTEESDSRND